MCAEAIVLPRSIRYVSLMFKSNMDDKNHRRLTLEPHMAGFHHEHKNTDLHGSVKSIGVSPQRFAATVRDF